MQVRREDWVAVRSARGGPGRGGYGFVGSAADDNQRAVVRADRPHLRESRSSVRSRPCLGAAVQMESSGRLHRVGDRKRPGRLLRQQIRAPTAAGADAANPWSCCSDCIPTVSRPRRARIHAQAAALQESVRRRGRSALADAYPRIETARAQLTANPRRRRGPRVVAHAVDEPPRDDGPEALFESHPADPRRARGERCWRARRGPSTLPAPTRFSAGSSEGISHRAECCGRMGRTHATRRRSSTTTVGRRHPERRRRPER